MDASTFNGSDFGNGKIRNVAAVGQQILNMIGDAARRAADRSRFAGLPRRYLDDVDMTPGEAEAEFADLESAELIRFPAELVHSV